jgi:hypothetical protein
MSDKTVLRPRIVDLQSGDPKLQDLHRYALHLLGGEDPVQTAHNASLLFLTDVNAFQHAGITDLDWVPSLYVEVDSREYEVSRRGMSVCSGAQARLEKATRRLAIREIVFAERYELICSRRSCLLYCYRSRFIVRTKRALIPMTMPDH